MRQPLIAVGVPVRRDGAVRYVLGAAVTPERLASMLRKQQLPADWVAAVFDRNGTIVARTHEAQRFVGQKGAPVLIGKIRAAREGAVQTQTLEGIPVVSVFSRAAVSGWAVAIGIPLDYFTTHLLYSLARLFLVAFIMLMIAATFAAVIARRMTA